MRQENNFALLFNLLLLPKRATCEAVIDRRNVERWSQIDRPGFK